MGHGRVIILDGQFYYNNIAVQVISFQTDYLF